MPQSSPICIHGEDRRVQESPTQDGRPECDAVWLEVAPSARMVLVSLVPNSMRTAPIVVDDPRFEDDSDVAFIQRNHEIQAFPACASNQALTKTIRLRAPVWCP